MAVAVPRSSAAAGISGSSSTRFSAAQIAQVAKAAGFRGEALVIAVAVALAESGGRVGVAGDVSLANSKWGPSIGLWQIRSLRREYRDGTPRDASRLGNPSFNAQSAFAISSGGTNFRPWTMFTNGGYRKFLNVARAAAGRAGRGGGIPGGDAATANFVSANDLGFQQPEVDARTRAKELYGYLGWYVDHPEVGPIILRAAREGWDQARLQGTLVKTRWWRTTSESARKFDALVVMDPATAKRRIAESDFAIRRLQSRFGVRFAGRQRFIIAVAAVRLGWNPEELQLSVASHAKWRPGKKFGGALGKTIDDVQALAGQYLIPVTRKQAFQWSKRIVAGAATMDSVETQFQRLAKARFPHLRRQIAQGVSPGEFFQPHRQVIAQTLERSVDDINLLSDRKWRSVLAFRPGRGKRARAMTLTETARFARMQPAWARTQQARDSVTEAGDVILQIFGRPGSTAGQATSSIGVGLGNQAIGGGS